MNKNSLYADGRVVISGTSVERTVLAANVAGKGTEFWETDGSKNHYVSDGVQWLQTGIDGAVFAISSLGNAETRNRLMNPDAAYAETTNRCTWTAAENVREIYLTLFGDADTTTSDKAWVVFDAVNSAAGVLLLAEAGGAAVDVQIFPLKYGERTGPFLGMSYFTALDIDLSDNGVLYVEAK